jgi:hypothetical protein
MAFPVMFVRGVPTPTVLVRFMADLHPDQVIRGVGRDFADERPKRLLGASTGRLVLVHSRSPETPAFPGCRWLVGQAGACRPTSRSSAHGRLLRSAA